ncbi:hypothetical protein [Methylorubrum podarium]|jgi:hypothetical protein|uniref:hypothetical protein n=1 Tax=Methylorubrum podarium TaxID=200476 RepID=UPI001EE1F6E6|nr:hypothetical protein [Methylorubrum podarium]GJE73368.1 hypothetical protein CHKEEEPN_4932 [Methylorubrum podarium]
MPYKIETTFSVVLAPIDKTPPTRGRARCAAKVVSHYGARSDPTKETVDRMREAAEVIAWINENIPATRIEAEVRDRAEDVRIIATFKSETDAVAFKTR